LVRYWISSAQANWYRFAFVAFYFGILTTIPPRHNDTYIYMPMTSTVLSAVIFFSPISTRSKIVTNKNVYTSLSA
jgi:hypothetical protein